MRLEANREVEAEGEKLMNSGQPQTSSRLSQSGIMSGR